MDWAARILRSLKLDVLACPTCGGRMKVISCLTQPAEIRKFLRSIGLSSEIPSRAPPRDPPQGEFEFAHQERRRGVDGAVIAHASAFNFTPRNARAPARAAS
jgi:hypothetical protein